MKTRTYHNPITALVAAAREAGQVSQLAQALAVAIEKHGNNRELSEPLVTRRVLRDVQEATGVTAEMPEDGQWQGIY